MTNDDQQLVKKAQEGDRDAFRSLVELYRRRVFAIAFGMVRDSDTALDISQEVFVKVYRKLGEFQGNSSFYTWLYRITINRSIDVLRKRKRVDEVDYNDSILRKEANGAEARLLPSSSQNNPFEALDSKELNLNITKAFEKLGPKHKGVLLLREVEGLSYEEIAQTLKINKGTVMSRLHHARQHLQRYLREYLDERHGFSLPKKNAPQAEAGTNLSNVP